MYLCPCKVFCAVMLLVLGCLFLCLSMAACSHPIKSLLLTPYEVTDISLLEDGQLCAVFRNGSMVLVSADLEVGEAVGPRKMLLEAIDGARSEETKRRVVADMSVVAPLGQQWMVAKYIVLGYPFHRAEKIRAWDRSTGEILYDPPLVPSNLLSNDCLVRDPRTGLIYHVDGVRKILIVIDPRSWSVKEIALPFTGLFGTLKICAEPFQGSDFSCILVTSLHNDVVLVRGDTLQSHWIVFEDAPKDTAAIYDTRYAALHHGQLLVHMNQEPYLGIFDVDIQSLSFNSTEPTYILKTPTKRLPTNIDIFGMYVLPLPLSTDNSSMMVYTYSHSGDYDSFITEIQVSRIPRDTLTGPSTEDYTISIQDAPLIQWTLQASPTKDHFGCIYVLSALGQISLYCAPNNDPVQVLQ